LNDLVRLATVKNPFISEREDFNVPQGLSISQMLEICLPDALKPVKYRFLVFVRGEIVPVAIWDRYRPKAGILVEVRAFIVPTGGGGGGGKNPLRTILSLAVIAAAWWAGPAVAGALVPTYGVATAATANLLTFTSAVFTAAIGAAGMLAVNAIAPVRPPKMAQLTSQSGQQDSPTLFIEGARNQLRPFSPVPVILGQYRHYPSLGAKPYTEVIGDKQFIRFVFVWGIGPLSIDTDSLKIGDTPLSQFTGYQIEHREGYDTDDPLTLFTNIVEQEDFSVLLSQATSWVQRTSAEDADELSVDITFPQGLVQFDDRGNKINRQVNIEIEYRLVGSSPWQKIDVNNTKFQTTFSSSWMNLSGSDLNSVTFNHSRTSAIRHGIRWGVATRGQYDIRIRRTSDDTISTQIFDQVFLTSIRTITNEDPINSPVPVAVTAMIIQATDQFTGIVDIFNGVVTSVAADYVGGSPAWVEQETQNPASLFRHVLQGNGSSSPLPNIRVDIETLEDWHQFCVAKGFEFNMIRDFQSSIWETLADIAAAGRAAPTQINGKWSVVIEDTKPVASYITPRNSFDFKAERLFINIPHGWRISFPNENEDFRLDERRVFRDGFNDGNATLYETIELPGVTNPDQIYKLGRFRIAQAILQPERWSFKQDMEYLTYKRGDRVLVTHDVLLVGLAFGRVKSVTLTGSPLVEVAEIEIDEQVTMESGNNYGVSIRNINGQVSGQVNTVLGATRNLVFSSPIPGVGSPAVPAIAVGDVLGFGILGQETDDASIISIIPDSDFRAQITAVPYREAIFNSDSEEIPAFETRLTALQSIPAPVIRNVISDESAMVLGSGETLKIRIGIEFDPLNQELFGVEPELRVQMRPSGTNEPWVTALIDSLENNHIFIANVRTAETWDIRLRFVVPNRLPGPWAVISSHLVVGKSTPPSPLSGMTISTFGAQALIRWDRPTELDVLFGGEVVFRHSPELDNPQLSHSVTIGQAARARTLSHVLPLKPGSYLAQVFDVAGNPSETITFVSTKQASVHEFASVDTLDEAPDWLGNHNDTVENSGDLTIDESASPAVLEGIYEFSQGIDLLSVQRVRLTTRLVVNIFDTSTNIDDRLDNMDDWEDFDQSLVTGADAQVYVRHTDDDPGGSPVTWSAWEKLDSAEFEARAFEFYVHLTRESLDYNILVDELGIDVDEVV